MGILSIPSSGASVPSAICTKCCRSLHLILLTLCLAGIAAAQTIPPDLEKRLADLDKATKSAQSAGDNAWMLVSAALVLMMTGPGLALFYGGLVRRKNVLGTMMHSFVLMGTGHHPVGGGRLQPGVRRGLLVHRRFAVSLPERRGSRAQCRLRRHHSAADLHDLPVDVRHHHPGADLRSLRRAHEILGHAAVHDAVVSDRVLPHGAHGVGQGRTVQRDPGRQNFRPSISRAERWCTSLAAFRRWSARSIWASATDIRNESMRPHSLVLSIIGACLLWVGWFGFNAGSALAASPLATSAFVATHFGAAAAALAWMAAEWVHDRQAQRAGRDLGMRWPGWWRSRRLPASSSRCPRC